MRKPDPTPEETLDDLLARTRMLDEDYEPQYTESLGGGYVAHNDPQRNYTGIPTGHVNRISHTRGMP
jgi:hypothetical protein